MPDNFLRIGAEFDVGNIVTGAEQVTTSLKGVGSAVGEASAEMLNALYPAEQVVAEGAEKAAVATNNFRSAMGQARVEMGALEGSTGMMAGGLARIAAQSEALAPIIQALFIPFAVVAFADIIGVAAEKVYRLYQNVILLKASIEELDKADMTLAEHAAMLNQKFDEGTAKILLEQNQFGAARDAFLKASEEKPLEFPKIDDKMFKQFSADFVTFMQAVHTQADAPTVITRINAESASTLDQLNKAKQTVKDLTEQANEPTAGEGGAGAALAVQLQRESALVTDLTKKYQFLQGIVGEIQSQTGIAAQERIRQLGEVDKRQTELQAKENEAAIRKINEAYEANEAMQREAEQELRSIEQVQRKKEEAARAAHELAVQEEEERHRMFEEIDRQLEQSEKKHEEIMRQQAEVDATIQARLDEGAKKAAEAWERSWTEASKRVASITKNDLEGMIRGTETVKFGFLKLAGDIVIAMARAMEEMLIKWVATHIAMTIAHATASEAQVAQTASAETQKDAIEQAHNLKSIIRLAAKAAAAAYSAVSEIPVIGPFLAPVAAAGAFVGVMAFESLATAEKGGIVPIAAHPGEMILPEHISSSLQGAIPAIERFNLALAGGGVAGSFSGPPGGPASAPATNLTHIAVNAFDAASFRDFMRNNQRQFTQQVRRMVRNRANF